jgi:uncharacterized protein YkwD
MRHKIYIALFLIITTNLFSQTDLEKVVLKELNLYRNANQLKPVVYSTAITKAAKHHTRWMVATNLCSHYETSDVTGIKTLYSPEDRGKFFGLVNNINSLEEICNETKSFEGNLFNATKKSDAKLGKDIIIKFSKSPPHNQTLLAPVNNGSYIRAGISVIIKGEIAYTTIFFIE